MTTKRIDLDVLTNYNTLDTVIEEFCRLREQYNGRCMVDLNIEYEPYEENSPYIEATLEIRD